MIHYFVSFSHNGGPMGGFGNCQIDRLNPIRSMADITAVTDLLRAQGVSNPVIVSFTRFEADTPEQQDTPASNPEASGPGEGVVFDYIQQLLHEQGRPMTAEQIATRLRLPADAVRRITTKALRAHKLVKVRDGRYTLPGGAR